MGMATLYNPSDIAGNHCVIKAMRCALLRAAFIAYSLRKLNLWRKGEGQVFGMIKKAIAGPVAELASKKHGLNSLSIFYFLFSFNFN